MHLCYMGRFESVHLKRWIKHFIEQGHQVSLLSFSGASLQMEGLKVHSLLANCSGDSPPPTSTPTLLFGAQEWAHRLLPLGLLTARMSLKWLRHGIKRKLEEIQPDILHGHFLMEYGFYAATTGFSPLVVSAWGSDLLIHPQRSLINRLLINHTLKRSSLVYVMAPFMARKIEEMGIHRGKIVSANFGVDEALLDVQAQSRNGRPILVCTRMLDHVYNHATLIKALAVVRKAHSEVLLRLAGDGPLRKPLEALVNELSLQTNVEFAGFLSGSKLIGALSTADLYLSTSLSDGTSVSLLEAMAVGLFPIVSNIEGNRDWIADGANGFLVDPHDPDALAARITLALSKVDWRREVCQQNKEIVKQRALRKSQMEIMEQAYRELLSEQ